MASIVVTMLPHSGRHPEVHSHAKFPARQPSARMGRVRMTKRLDRPSVIGWPVVAVLILTTAASALLIFVILQRL